MIWSEKHKPKNYKEVVGQDEPIKKLRYAIVNKKPVILSGGTGTGKTSAVYAIANDLNYEILEINASDLRNKEEINSVIGNAMKQQSLFYKGKIILVDEIDGLNYKDRGGAQALNLLLYDNRVPIVMTTNDAYNDKLRTIRKNCELIEFKGVGEFDIIKLLQKILNIEKINYDMQILKEIAMNSGGDLRGAINDLQVLSSGKEMLDKIEGVSNREKKKAIFEILNNIFKKQGALNILGCLRDIDMDMDEFFLWLDENLPKEYSGDDLIDAYEKLSRADVFNGRIKNQKWRLLVYRDNLMTCGVNICKNKINNRFIGYKRSGKLLKIWINNARNKYKKSIVEKLSRENHVSKRKFGREVLPYMKVIARNSNLDFGLENEEMEWLKR